MPTSRKVAKQTEAEFRDKAGAETHARSAVAGSLDKMAGSSQEPTRERGVRKKLDRSAKALSRG